MTFSFVVIIFHPYYYLLHYAMTLHFCSLFLSLFFGLMKRYKHTHTDGDFVYLGDV